MIREIGLTAAGLYQSAWGMAGQYLGLVLQSMGTDYYPRLKAVASDNVECNRVVHEQAMVSLMLAGPRSDCDNCVRAGGTSHILLVRIL